MSCIRSAISGHDTHIEGNPIEQHVLVCSLMLGVFDIFSKEIGVMIQNCLKYPKDKELCVFEATDDTVVSLTHYSPVCFSIPPENIRKPLGFLMFSGSIEKQHWTIMAELCLVVLRMFDL